MRFRTKLLLTFLAIVLAINGLTLLYFYRSTRALQIAELREKILSVAASGAAVVDGDLHRTIKTPQDEQLPAYAQLRDGLRKIRDANRRQGTYVRYMYTLAPSSDSAFVFVLDADEDPKDISHPGDAYRYHGAMLRVGAAYADTEFSYDQWGTWLSAYAPIRDHGGRIIAMLGADISAASVEAALRPLKIVAAFSLAGAALLTLIAGLWLSSRVSRPLLAIRGVVRRIGTGDLDARAHAGGKDEFSEVGAAINEMAVGLRERQAIKSAFARYVSGQVLDTILASGRAPAVEGDRRKITVLFSDIRSFTSLAERLTPEEVVQLLNEYFALMVDVIFRHHGTLDKFLGDGLMVIFGAPTEDPDQEQHAIQAAIEMQHAVRGLSLKWEAEGKQPIRIGIGICSGYAIVGNVGSEERLEYTAIGDTVNLASRLESATKEVGVDILIADTTVQGLRDLFRGRQIGPIHVRNRHEPVMTYTIDAPAPVLA